jgi:hypothetical protein
MNGDYTQVIPPSPGYKQQIVREYAQKYSLHILIETGTYLGEMVDAVKNDFKQIISIELAQVLYERAIKKFEQFSHIKICFGDSSKILQAILVEIKEPCLFWLDAHCSGGITTRGDKVTPIMEELNLILKRRYPEDILLIDDARGFTGSNDYPTVEEVIALVKRYDPKYQIEVNNDIIRVFK